MEISPRVKVMQTRLVARPALSAAVRCHYTNNQQRVQPQRRFVRRQAAAAVSVQEEEANKKRWEESGKKDSIDAWQWTLNWDDINDSIAVGSCPRSTDDLATLNKAGFDAILNLQSDGCFDALNIEYPQMKSFGTRLGMTMARVPIWDFNHADQALMLPEAVRKLALLEAMGKRVYVHCTAGINRASLTVVGYHTFVKGWSLEDAVKLVKSKRSQAHPYIDCWKTARSRLVEGRTEEILNTAANLYEKRKANGGSRGHNDSVADWVNAETLLIKEAFQRQIEADLSLVVSINDLEGHRESERVCLTHDEFAHMQAEMGLLRDKADQERGHARAALAAAAKQAEENRKLREAKPNAAAMLESQDMRLARLKAAEVEIGALKNAIREVAMSALRAHSQGPEDLAEASSDAQDGDSSISENGAAAAAASNGATASAESAEKAASENGSAQNGAAQS